MTALLMAAAVSVGIPAPVSGAINAFDGGSLYLRTIGMEPEGDFRRNGSTGIPEYTEGCESSRELDRELELWNLTMLKLWSEVNTAETNFTVRSGEEYLIYQGFLLFYTCPECRTGIPVHPEELWTILNHLGRNPSAATSQISLEGWYPGLDEPRSAFVSVYDPAYEAIERLFDLGRAAIPLE